MKGLGIMSLKKLRKYILFIYIVVLLIFSLTIFIFYFSMKQQSRGYATENQQELTAQYSEQIDNMLKNMDNVALLIMQDTMFLQSFSGLADSDPENYFNVHFSEKTELLGNLERFYTTNEAAERISVYNNNNDYVSYGILYETNEKVKEFLSRCDVDKTMKEIKAAQYGRRIVCIEDDIRGNGETLISVKRNLMNIGTGETFAVIDIQRRLEDLESIFGTYNDENQIFVFNAFGDIIFTNTNKTGADLINKVKEQKSENKRLSGYQWINKSNDFLTWSQGDQFEWTVAIVQPESTLLGTFRTMSQYIWFLTLGFLAANFILVIIVINKLMRPLHELSISVSKVNLGNMTMTLKNDSHMNEISRINSEFEQMFQRLNLSIKNEMRYQFEALQAQMNPHFLYNTLSVISAEAIQDNSDKIPELCDRLAKMLRYSSDYEHRIVTVEEELAYSLDYLSLMKERYHGKLIFKVECAGDTKKICIPKISIQPLIENCFKHGFANKDFPWRIYISVQIVDDSWRVEIEDNGNGINKETEQQIREKIEMSANHKIGGMGLVNTISRFRFFCGENFYYDFHSEPNEGMKVIIGGETIDQSYNCRR
ncbi:histidine kinase [Mediterraneibacter glycyrrhizinilyticus]|uniref:sensor histidine kinase n=1 Tax=Mediterraneibacter glycyrrhizinilyticus TaxID=342942 RepID=UPI001962063F|nr:sensor histidine kinase [Mediterraneibacter glycyrrhizinilyticus]MBM6750562.1 histidine kinase [Mediterraneibacter glycyrrhizinilyticus]